MSESTTEESLRLLALDGGGIRGWSSLQVLRHLLREVQVEEGLPEMPLPCEYFDLIGGTSTGGIIALMLGRLRMSVDDALRKYAELSKEVFSKRQFVGDGKFKASNLEGAIKKVIAGQRAASHDAEARMMDDGSCGVVCKTFVCATAPNAIAAPVPTLFRTYEPRHGRLINCKIWEAARATSAAPIFFRPIKIDTGYGVYTRYTDGGLGNNNPTDLVLQEAHKLFPDRKIACIISIGTGRPKNPKLSRPGIFQCYMPRVDVAKAVGKIVTDCDKTAEAMERRFHHSPNVYFRFNVEHGMDGIELGDWEKLDEVHDITNAYLTSEKVEKAMENAAAAIRARRGVVTTGQASGALAQIVTRSRPVATRKLCPPPTPFFTGRDDIVRQMQTYFTGPSERRRIFALYGLGGSGKSEISRMFVKVVQGNESNRFSELFYVDASSEETIETDLGNIAMVEQIGDSAADTMRWMESQRDWLLILDNADDPHLDLSRFIPQTVHGNTIITSRNAQTHTYGLPSGAYREILKMAPADAKELFLRRAGLKIEDQPYTLNDHEDAVIQTIVKELDYFALAIIQASAYIASNPTCNPEKYLGMYQERRRELLEEYKNDVQKLDSYRGTVYTTWNISFENLQRHNPLAATFLRVCAFLHNESISEAIFRNAAAGMLSFKSNILSSEAVISWVTDFLHSFMILDNGIWDERKFLAVVQDLCSYSLMSTSGGSDLSIHLLVQDWARTYHNNPVIPTYTSFLLGLSISYSYYSDLPRQANYAHDIRKLLPHVQEVQRHCEHLELYVAGWFARTFYESGRYKSAESLEMVVREGLMDMFGEEHPEILMSMHNLALTYRHQGRWAEAERLQTTVMEARKRVLDEEHPNTLTGMHNLALTYQNQGRWAEAETLQATVMEARKRVLGEEHPDTLTSMHNLALTYQSQGRWAEAEMLQVTVMEASKRVLGEEHPSTLTNMNILASIYRDQGRWAEAERLQKTVMEARKRVLGEEHPHILTSMDNLALTYRDQGRWAEAERLQETVMEASKRVLGQEHPDTLTSMNNLALTYRDQGRWAEAERLQVTVMEAMKRMLGDEHPDTLTSMHNLASTYQSQGRWAEAERLQVTVMEASKRVRSEEHPDTLASMHNLALTYQDQGRWAEAERLQVTVMEASKRVRSEEHPSTLTSMHNLALTYGNQGRWAEAERLQVTVMEAMKRMLGDEHPDTLTSMHNLASTYQSQGRWAEAERLQVTVMEASKRVRSEEHPDTLASMHNLALTYQDQGRWAEAERLQVTVMEASKRVLGQEHPDTLTSMNNLALTYRDQGRWAEAERLQVTVMEAMKRMLGDEHPDTLTSMHNLASTYQSQGRWAEAERLQVTVMEASKRVRSEEHPDTLASMHNLALTYQDQGRWAEAERLQVTVMEASKRVRSEEHPSTLTSMHNLALTYGNQGRWAEAERLQATVTEASKRVLGEEHPYTLRSMEDLAFTYRRLDRLSDASRLKAEVEDIRKRLVVQRGHEAEADSSTSHAS